MRSMQPYTVAVLSFLLACGGSGPAPSAGTSEEPVAAPAPAVLPTPAARACCADAAVVPVVRAVLDASAALAADDDARARGSLEAAAAAIDAATPSAAEASRAPLAALGASVKASVSAADVKARRDAFKAVSRDALALAASAGASGELSFREAFCPMADAGWMQTSETVANPYYGASMLTCGSFK